LKLKPSQTLKEARQSLQRKRNSLKLIFTKPYTMTKRIEAQELDLYQLVPGKRKS